MYKRQGLDRIEETETGYRIGAMVPLRALETHAGLAVLTQGAMAEALRHIVGVQFRNCATVGGSLWGRFGFSDVLTLFLALDAAVTLHHAGEMPLADFAALPRVTRDILTHVTLPKASQRAVYLSQRNISTDFPVPVSYTHLDGPLSPAANCPSEPAGEKETAAGSVSPRSRSR